MPEAAVEEEDDEEHVLRKLKPKIPDHNDAHPVAEDMNLRKDCHAQYATLSKRNSKVPPRIDPHIDTLLQGGHHYINIT